MSIQTNFLEDVLLFPTYFGVLGRLQLTSRGLTQLTIPERCIFFKLKSGFETQGRDLQKSFVPTKSLMFSNFLKQYYTTFFATYVSENYKRKLTSVESGDTVVT